MVARQVGTGACPDDLLLAGRPADLEPDGHDGQAQGCSCHHAARPRLDGDDQFSVGHLASERGTDGALGGEPPPHVGAPGGKQGLAAGGLKRRMASIDVTGEGAQGIGVRLELTHVPSDGSERRCYEPELVVLGHKESGGHQES